MVHTRKGRAGMRRNRAAECGSSPTQARVLFRRSAVFTAGARRHTTGHSTRTLTKLIHVRSPALKQPTLVLCVRPASCGSSAPQSLRGNFPKPTCVHGCEAPPVHSSQRCKVQYRGLVWLATQVYRTRRRHLTRDATIRFAPLRCHDPPRTSHAEGV